MSLLDSLFEVISLSTWVAVPIVFMMDMLGMVYVGFKYGVVGITLWNTPIWILVIREWLRWRRIKKEDGWETSEERMEEIMKELSKTKRI